MNIWLIAIRNTHVQLQLKTLYTFVRCNTLYLVGEFLHLYCRLKSQLQLFQFCTARTHTVLHFTQLNITGFDL